jgi:hypothetical protein
MLPAHDSVYLAERFPAHNVTITGGVICVVISAFALGAGFTEAAADLLLRLAPGYPDVPPDMWWFSPHVRRLDGRTIPATDAIQTFFNKPWQRWSRHLGPGQWRSGVDCLESYLAIVRRELDTAGAKAAA